MGIIMTIQVQFISIDPRSREERSQALRALLLEGARRASQTPSAAVESADRPPVSVSSQVVTLEKYHG